MNKQQFLGELKQLLGDIPAVERDEALGYYEDYFEDAGPEYESSIIQELESPEKIAFMIKAGLRDSDKSVGEFTERGFTGYGPYDRDELANKIPSSDDRGFTQRNTSRQGISLLVIILLICALPIILPVLFSVLGVLFGVFCATFAIIFSVAIAGIACIVAGVIVAIVGIPGFAIIPAGALMVSGLGIGLIGLGILLTMAGVGVATKVVPKVFKAFVSLIQTLMSHIKLPIKRRTMA